MRARRGSGLPARGRGVHPDAEAGGPGARNGPLTRGLAPRPCSSPPRKTSSAATHETTLRTVSLADLQAIFGSAPSCLGAEAGYTEAGYTSGTTSARSTVVAKATTPTAASSGVHVLSVSTSLSPPILAKIQKPESFIHEPTSDPLAMAVAR